MTNLDKKKSDLLKENDYLQANHLHYHPSKDVSMSQIAGQLDSLNGALLSKLGELKAEEYHNFDDREPFGLYPNSMQQYGPTGCSQYQ